MWSLMNLIFFVKTIPVICIPVLDISIVRILKKKLYYDHVSYKFSREICKKNNHKGVYYRESKILQKMMTYNSSADVKAVVLLILLSITLSPIASGKIISLIHINDHHSNFDEISADLINANVPQGLTVPASTVRFYYGKEASTVFVSCCQLYH
jgi:hypothetical protein